MYLLRIGTSHLSVILKCRNFEKLLSDITFKCMPGIYLLFVLLFLNKHSINLFKSLEYHVTDLRIAIKHL